MRFGDTLKKLLEEKEISQKQLAKELNIAPSTIGNYIQNTREPDFETLKYIARFFEVTIDYLLGYQAKNSDISTIKEADLLRIFRSLSNDQQELYLEQGRAFIRINSKNSMLEK